MNEKTAKNVLKGGQNRHEKTHSRIKSYQCKSVFAERTTCVCTKEYMLKLSPISVKPVHVTSVLGPNRLYKDMN